MTSKRIALTTTRPAATTSPLPVLRPATVTEGAKAKSRAPRDAHSRAESPQSTKPNTLHVKYLGHAFGWALVLMLLCAVPAHAQLVVAPPAQANLDRKQPRIPTHVDLPSDFATRFHQYDNLQIAFIHRLFDLTAEQKVQLQWVEDQRDAVVDEILVQMISDGRQTWLIARVNLFEYNTFYKAYTAKRQQMFADVLKPVDRDEYLRQSQARAEFNAQANEEAITARLDEQLWFTSAQRDAVSQSLSSYAVPPSFNLLLHLVPGSILPPLAPFSKSAALESKLSANQHKLLAYMQSSAMQSNTPATYVTVANAQGVIPIPGKRYQPDEQLAPVFKLIGEICDPPTFIGPRNSVGRQPQLQFPILPEAMRRIDIDAAPLKRK